MASLKNNRLLFFTTSPRTPLKMLPEIKLLTDVFHDKQWNQVNQIKFMIQLIEQGEFNGDGSLKHLDLSARDRVNRAPKALGFVDLKPSIKLTGAGYNFLNYKRKEEVLLRQLLKFQFPSPYHTQSSENPTVFYVKPYLEILRLINDFGSLTFDEVMIFGMQLTDYRKYDEVVKKILEFRKSKKSNKSPYKSFRQACVNDLIVDSYEDKIKTGLTKIRESNDSSLKKFTQTKARNLRDYTDACFRYLRASGIVTVSQQGKSISIAKNFQEDVDFILCNIDRNPIYIDDEENYKKQLFDPEQPTLLSDDVNVILRKLCELTHKKEDEFAAYSFIECKDLLYTELEKKKKCIISNQITKIKKYEEYDDIMTTFDDIEKKELLDLPLMLEWNVWRAMTMLNGGVIQANLKFDDEGKPMSTAMGNMADIECSYEEFDLIVEVTMASGQRQYETESEPVSRHLAKYKQKCKKPAYCLFIAPNINDACIAHFFTLHKVNISYYGGTSVIVPIDLMTFRNMIESSHQVSYKPSSIQVKELFEYSSKIVAEVKDEVEWYTRMKCKFSNWLEI